MPVKRQAEVTRGHGGGGGASQLCENPSYATWKIFHMKSVYSADSSRKRFSSGSRLSADVGDGWPEAEITASDELSGDPFKTQ